MDAGKPAEVNIDQSKTGVGQLDERDADAVLSNGSHDSDVQAQHSEELPPDEDGSALLVSQADAVETGSTAPAANGDAEVRVISSKMTPAAKREPEDVVHVEAPARKKSRLNRPHPNIVPPYDVNDEKGSSQLAVDQACFKEAEELVRFICGLVINKADELHEKGYADDEIKTIMKKLKKMRFLESQYPKSKAVGFLGDTAAGKSTLINSLLSKDNVAAESDEGSSGTSVIQELRMSELDQIDTFKAEVLFHRKRSVGASVVKHFEHIYDFLLGEKDEFDHDEEKTMQDDYSTAMEFFTALLCDRDQMRDKASAEAFFRQATGRDDLSMIGKLKQSINEAVKAADSPEFTANTTAELNKMLARFKGPVKTSPPTPSMWPVVRKIVTYVNARILSEGTTLADLPGTSDISNLRVQATREYLKTCDVVVIAHPIPRIQSQDSVWSNVIECVRTGKQSNIILVCTKIDDFNHNRTRECVSDREAAYLQGLRGAAENLAGEIKELDLDIADAEDDGDAEMAAQLNRKRRSMAIERAKADAALLEANILMRNQRNEAALQQKFRQITRSNAELRIHYVSSQVYQEHMRGYDQNKPPQLSLEATGIPGLRQDLFERPAKQKMASLNLLGFKILPRVLLALEMQCGRSLLERKEDVQVTVQAPHKEILKLVSTMKTELRRACEDALDAAILQYEAGWKAEAMRHHDSWVKYKYSRYAAFLRRYGVWRAPGKKELVDWTAMINEIAAEGFTAAFRDFKLHNDRIKLDFLGQADSLLVDLDTQLRESPELMGQNLDHFYLIITKVRETVADKVTEAFRQLQDQINHVCYDATSTNADHSYFKQTMQLTYNNCRLRKGDGVFKQYQGVMMDKLTGPKNVFMVVKELALAAAEERINEWADVLSKKVGRQFESIIDDFDRRFADVEEEDGAKRTFRKELQVAVEQAMQVVDTKLKAKLDACAKYR